MMKYQKVTYSGTKCNNYIYFAFYAEQFDTNAITKELNIVPTSTIIKKEPIPKETCWEFKIEAHNDINLETHLEKLIDVFENKVDRINHLKKILKLQTILCFVVDIDINPEISTPYFGLNKRTIDFLAKTDTAVNFDIYKADTIGIFKSTHNE